MRTFWKWTLRLTGGFIIFLIFLWLLLLATGNSYLFKGIRATYLQGATSATIDDQKFFAQRPIYANFPDPLPKHKLYGEFGLKESMLEQLRSSETAAFVIVKSDSLIYEWYRNSDASQTHNSFSMAKTVVAILAQIAVEEGILGWNDKVIGYLPDLKGPYANDLQVWQLAAMVSGLEWEEHYTSPFSIMAKAYYGENLEELLLRQPITHKPGKTFHYNSGNTQLLGMVIEKATQRKLSHYAQEKLWNPLGMETSASWHLDREDGMEKAYCCLNATARDFARIGMLINKEGRWKSRPILSPGFFHKAKVPTINPNYGWSFWIAQSKEGPIAYLRGILGQYIIPFPERNLVVVRLGHQQLPKTDGHHHDDFYQIVEYIQTHFSR